MGGSTHASPTSRYLSTPGHGSLAHPAEETLQALRQSQFCATKVLTSTVGHVPPGGKQYVWLLRPRVADRMRLSLPAGQDRVVGGSLSHTTPGGRKGSMGGFRVAGMGCGATAHARCLGSKHSAGGQAAISRAGPHGPCSRATAGCARRPRGKHLWDGTLRPSRPQGSSCNRRQRGPSRCGSSQRKESKHFLFEKSWRGTKPLRTLRGVAARQRWTQGVRPPAFPSRA